MRLSTLAVQRILRLYSRHRQADRQRNTCIRSEGRRIICHHHHSSLQTQVTLREHETDTNCLLNVHVHVVSC